MREEKSPAPKKIKMPRDPENREKENRNFEIRFYESVLEKKQDFLQALMALGDLYTKNGLYEKGLEVDRRLAKMRPDDPFILYNLACSYSLVNHIDKAFQVMKLAIESGYDDFAYLEHDRDLENLLKDQQFRRYLSQVKPSRKSQSENDV